MSTALFRLYEDPENANATQPLIGKSQTGGKNVLGGGVPRRALGDLNQQIPNRTTEVNEFKKPATPAPSINRPIKSSDSHGIDSIKKSEAKTTIAPVIPLCPFIDQEIERPAGPLFGEQEDDFEDILPKSERISSYLSKLISWRPSCLGAQEDNDLDLDSSLEDLSDLEILVDHIDMSVTDYGPIQPVPEPPAIIWDDLYDQPTPSDSLNQSQSVLKSSDIAIDQSSSSIVPCDQLIDQSRESDRQNKRCESKMVSPNSLDGNSESCISHEPQIDQSQSPAKSHDIITDQSPLLMHEQRDTTDI